MSFGRTVAGGGRNRTLTALCTVLVFSALIAGAAALPHGAQAEEAQDDVITQEGADASEDVGSVSQAPVKKGLVTENGNLRYYKGGVAVTSKKVAVGGATYYFNAKGNAVKGKAVKVAGAYRVFANNGKLLTPSKKKIYKLKTGYYYVSRKGAPAQTGWFIKAGKLYYATKAGKLKSSGSRQGIAFSSKGYAKNKLPAKLKMVVMKIVAQVTKPSWSKQRKFAALRQWCIKNGHWSMRCAVNDVENPAWVQRQAYECFTGPYTMCIGGACEMAMFAYELGYEPTVYAIPNYHGCVYVNGKRYDWNNPQLSMQGAYKFKVVSYSATSPKTQKKVR